MALKRYLGPLETTERGRAVFRSQFVANPSYLYDSKRAATNMTAVAQAFADPRSSIADEIMTMPVQTG